MMLFCFISFIVCNEMKIYVTKGDQSQLFRESSVNDGTSNGATVTIDRNTQYQTMEGFGFAITGSTAYNLLQMPEDARSELLNKAFNPNSGMGCSFVRVSIGCSDFSVDFYTYCDVEGLGNFGIHPIDRAALLPILKQIKSINPNVKIMAAPWTAPKWMKVDDPWCMIPHPRYDGGRLNPNHYYNYAMYLVKYCEQMRDEGLHVDYLSVQNEPLNGQNCASMYWSWGEMRDFIKQQLGPRFREYGIDTKIIVYDHNYNFDDKSEEKDFPLNIYNDGDASQYIDGSAWHAYGGDPSILDHIHNSRSDKGIYFTEMSIGDWGYSFWGDLMWCMREVALSTINRNSKAVILFNFLLDNEHGPYRPGGCTNCFGAVNVNKNNRRELAYNSHYYIIGHLAKVIKPGAKRLRNTQGSPSNVYTAVFRNPDGSFALVGENDNGNDIQFVVDDGSRKYQFTFPAGSIISAKWNA
ncbi:O-Glycosyl hydrolase family 30 protein [Tritrichomonas foetus]|uniref:O-Glycosyl hydrolase family 30 protein n=1 Tax=Tritrichomonas foetus TaxID=1144522 RepID=A0A1J4JED9_9EUKA|nr:O-Glycosyl hydrolase family 30 protein [Tritrichomonas foetus]|eukprot:OHS96019.1 O-Glycosyl hydrolase family 30 protein [Tritrichomonas foetus]